MMTIQPLLPFAEVPVTCPTQAKYHAIAPCLAGQIEPKQQAKLLNLFRFYIFSPATIRGSSEKSKFL